MMKNMQKFFDDIPEFKKFQYKGNRPQAQHFSYEWKTDYLKKTKTLILKMKLAKNQPIDIKIEKRSVIVKGQIKEEIKTKNRFSKRTYSINESIAIPSDYDEKKAEFKSIDNDIHITFPKKASK